METYKEFRERKINELKDKYGIDGEIPEMPVGESETIKAFIKQTEDMTQFRNHMAHAFEPVYKMWLKQQCK